MFGGPGETPETIRETLDFARTAIRPTDTAFFTSGIRIYPGTPLERIAREEGVLTAAPAEMLRPAFYVSPQITLAGLNEELHEAARDHLNFIAGSAIALPLMQQVIRVSYRLGLRPPLWRHSRHIRRVLRMLRMYQ
jgi:radical SAM superfamily enzyme YgiQ (UPF0313 family)